MIGKVISLITGILFIVTAVSMSTKITDLIPKVEQGMTVCNSNLGRIGSFLFGGMAQKCEQVNQVPALIGYGNIMVVVFYTIGGGCTAYGTIGLVGEVIIGVVRRRN